MKMTWEYLAGFFDGEGSIHIREHVQCRVVQAKFQGDVIFEIERFLKKQGIPCSVRERQYGTTLMLYLTVTSTLANYRFLRKISPFLRVKKQKALEALSYIKNNWGVNDKNCYDPLKKNLIRGSASKSSKLTEKDIPVIREEWAKGVSGPKLGKRFGVSFATIYDIAYGRAWTHV